MCTVCAILGFKVVAVLQCLCGVNLLPIAIHTHCTPQVLVDHYTTLCCMFVCHVSYRICPNFVWQDLCGWPPQDFSDMESTLAVQQVRVGE